MRLTRNGFAAAALSALTLFAALASGNNLLYLLYALLLSGLAVSAVSARGALNGLEASVTPPPRLFAKSRARIAVILKNGAASAARLVRFRFSQASLLFPELKPQEELKGELAAELPHRGRNSLEGLSLESAFPFGLIAARRALGRETATAWPRPKEGEDGAPELGLASGGLKPKRGGGDEFYALRPYAQGDDARQINWKRSAAGKILVNEYADLRGRRITVEARSNSDAAIAAAAGACARHIARGAEVSLKTVEGEIGFGSGPGHLDRILGSLALLGAGREPRPATAASTAEADPAALAAWTNGGGFLIAASLGLIEEIPRGLIAGLFPVLALGALMDRRGRHPIPSGLWHLLSLLVLAYILLVDWGRSGITLANTHLLTYLIINRALSHKTGQDLRQTFLIHFLAVFLISGQTVSVYYFPAFAAYALYAAGWLYLEAGNGAPFTASLWKPAAASLAAAVLAFTATPRIEPLRRMNPFAAMGLDKRRPEAEFVVKFSETVSLGWFGELKKSSARVMRVRPLGAERPSSLLIRGIAFDSFDGRSWKKTARPFSYQDGSSLYFAREGRAWIPRKDGRLRFPGQTPREDPGLEFSILPLDSAVLFSVDGLGELETADQAVFVDAAETAYFGAKYLGGISYRLRGSRSPAGFAESFLDSEHVRRELFLGLPEGLDPRIARRALEITQEAENPAQKAQAVQRHLRENFSYSLYSAEEGLSLPRFLFEVKKGNCEYFATAAAVLLRAAGVPSRLVTGFAAEDWNEYGGFFDVRQGQAHAWVEAWGGEELGWLTVDATPPASELSRRSDALIERARRWFNAAQYRWYRHVIGYDSFSQRDAFLKMRLSFGKDALEKTIERGGRLLGISALILAALWLAAHATALLRSKPPRRFERASHMLKGRGFSRKPSQTVLEFAESVLSRSGDLNHLKELAALDDRERWSGRALSTAENEKADRLLSELRSALRKKSSTS